MARPAFFRRRPMDQLAQEADARGIRHDTSLAPVAVPVPPLVTGAPFLQHWPVRQQPGGASWTERSYRSESPWVFTLPDAIIHSAAGIVCVGDAVIEETLVHTDPAQHAYLPDRDGIWIDTENTTPLGGTHLSVLAGSGESYYHPLVDGLARLAVVPPDLLHTANGLITAAGRPATVGWVLQRLRDLWRLALTAVPAGGSLRVERLVLAYPNQVACNYHPAVADWFAGIAKMAGTGAPGGARRIFIDRRGAAARPLVEEAEVIAALQPLGIEPVALEFLSAEAQIALFRSAELVVSPHGAGLANLLFAEPGCRVVELQMDAYCHWCFRRLAALKGLPYDCVLGRAEQPWPDLAGPIHRARWHLSVPHVVAAVQSALA